MNSKFNVLKPQSKISTIKCTNIFFINTECIQKYKKNRKIQDLYKLIKCFIFTQIKGLKPIKPSTVLYHFSESVSLLRQCRRVCPSD